MRIRENVFFGAGRLCTTAILGFLLTTACACQRTNKGGDAMPQKDINVVMEAHVNELMAIPKVVGVAIGELEDKTPCILVLVMETTEEIERKVPKKLEGHPVRIEVTGVIRPMDSD
jgi:hypothetical protein